MTEMGHISEFSLDRNVNIDKQDEVPQHVISGVRFLYKQFVKHNPGVILNDPADYDQETQVALFLNGICRGQNQNLSVLILCERESMSTWKDCLMKWIPNYEDVVAVDWAKPTSKRSVYVTEHPGGFLHREWGVVVLHGDSILSYKFPRDTFTGAFKIFITEEDLRENLQQFSKIYKRLYPYNNISIEDFMPNKNSISDVIQKRIWFEAFVQDVLVRNARSIAQVSANTHREVLKQPKPRGITRRNKDATGAKIKRTKRKLDEEVTEISNKNKVSINYDEEEKNEINISYSKSSFNDDCDHQSNLDVESFITDQEPLKMEESYDISDVDHNMSITTEKMDVTKAKTNIELSDSDINKPLKMEETNDISDVDHNMSITSEKMDVTKSNIEVSDSDANSMKLNYSDDMAVNSEDAYALDTQDNGVSNDELIYKEAEVIDANAVTKVNEVSNNSTVNIKESDHDNLTISSDVKDDLKIGESKAENFSTEHEKHSKDNTDHNGIKKIVAKADDLESKWEEMALKKFKGSLLDRFF